ncbi:MAG: 1-deoxy-D-xylulose-5-phosphate synthase [Actinobacteria bacterium]|nr:1-deoxy-D-xylulose-5-phosphate synthase [Actinomycetota bacterium]
MTRPIDARLGPRPPVGEREPIVSDVIAERGNETDRKVERSVLDALRAPADLAPLRLDELEALADDIREVIIDSVTEHGGHLGSNLGAVELTLALHRVFESPRDVLLWDTGHQAYAHKIVTGRAQAFAGLREAGRLSGYPSRYESEHDWVENSHASTILAYTHGIAAGFALQGGEQSGRHVVAVIGDGSLTGGMAWEGLNNLGHSGTDCVIVFNDNGRSYAPTASELSTGLLNAGEGSPGFFEVLGLGYVGPVNGHDIAATEQALRAAAARPGPTVVHVLTEKGRGYAPAETDPVKRLHDLSEAAPGSYTFAFGQSLVELAAEDHRIVAITAAMPDSTGLLPFKEHFPDRFLDVGIAEQHAVTTAAGLAMSGMVPVVAVYSTFLTRAIDQLIYDVGLHRLPVVFCIDRAGITGDDGPSHHGVLDMVMFSKVPGMTILAPSSHEELAVMLRDALAIATGPNPGPVAGRWSKTKPPRVGMAEVGHELRARRVHGGDDLCIIAAGKTLAAASEARDLLAASGISVTLWDPRCIKPLDDAMVRDAARHRWVMTIEDGLREGGMGSAVVDRLHQLRMNAAGDQHVQVLGTPLAYIPHGKPDAVLAELGLGPHGIAESARELVYGRPSTGMPHRTGMPDRVNTRNDTTAGSSGGTTGVLS